MKLRREVSEFLWKVDRSHSLAVITGRVAVVVYIFLCACKLFLESRPNPGFFVGIVDGWASPVMAVADIFNSNVDMFTSPHESGYGIGFLIGVMLAFACIVGLLIEDDGDGGGGGNQIPQDPQPLLKQPLPKQEPEVKEKPRFNINKLN